MAAQLGQHPERNPRERRRRAPTSARSRSPTSSSSVGALGVAGSALAFTADPQLAEIAADPRVEIPMQHVAARGVLRLEPVEHDELVQRVLEHRLVDAHVAASRETQRRARPRARRVPLAAAAGAWAACSSCAGCAAALASQPPSASVHRDCATHRRAPRGTCRLPCGRADGSGTPNGRAHRPSRGTSVACPAAC